MTTIPYNLTIDAEEVNNVIDNIMLDVSAELTRACQLYPQWPLNNITGAAIVVEEAGELLQAALDFEWHQKTVVKTKMYNEAIQTIAMGLRFLIHNTIADKLEADASTKDKLN